MDNKKLLNGFLKKIEGGKESFNLGAYLLYKLEELLKNLELIEWAIDEAPDVATTFWDYQENKLSERFFKHFSLLEDIKDVQEGFDQLLRKNLNIYFITLISIYESYLNLNIRELAKKSNLLKLPFYIGKYEYFVNERGDLSLRNNVVNTEKEIEFLRIKDKLWCFHYLINTKKPKKKFLFLNKNDFEYYSIIRNQILHSDEKMLDSELLSIYKDVKEEIFTKDNKILISKKFFNMALVNLFYFCHDIAIAYEKRINNVQR